MVFKGERQNFQGREGAISLLTARLTNLTQNWEPGVSMFFEDPNKKAIGVVVEEIESKKRWGNKNKSQLRVRIWGVDLRDVEAGLKPLAPVVVNLEGKQTDEVLRTADVDELNGLAMLFRPDRIIGEDRAVAYGIWQRENGNPE